MSSEENEFQRKIRSLGFPRKFGQSEKRPVVDERDGSIGGHHVVHWDGSQDAHVIAGPVRGFGRPQEGKS